MAKEIPLSKPNLNHDIIENLSECIKTGWVSTGGRFISEFEEKVASYLDLNDTVACQSGTAGLHTALRMLGVGINDEVIVSTLTFIAAVNPIKYLGAEPVFMDCDDNFCLDVNKLRQFCENECEYKESALVNKSSGRTVKAIVPVHVFGNICDMDSIMDIAKKYNLKVLEDATEALGSYYTTGRFKGYHAGTIGDIGVLSFNANKIITTGGGGMILSRNEAYINEARYLTTTAKDDGLYFAHDEVGYNYRMLNLQAALGVSQIDELESFIKTKIKNYDLYKAFLSTVAGVELLPYVDGIRANHWFYCLQFDNEYFKEEKGIENMRDHVMKNLINQGIQSRPVWKLVHTQKPYENNQSYNIEKAFFYENCILNVPCSSDLTSEEVEQVSDSIIKLIT